MNYLLDSFRKFDNEDAGDVSSVEVLRVFVNSNNGTNASTFLTASPADTVLDPTKPKTLGRPPSKR